MRKLLNKLFPVGTRSVLWGIHNPLWHGPTVWLAYYQLYGREAFSLPVFAACFLHDVGYFGKPNMDGPEGDEHPRLGAKLMHWLFDRPDYATQDGELDSRTFQPVYKSAESWEWHDFALLHSRHFAHKYGRPFSKLAVADKLAISITPWWMYIPLTTLSGEINEYLQHGKDASGNNAVPIELRMALMSGKKRVWLSALQEYMQMWCDKHKDGAADTWSERAA